MPKSDPIYFTVSGLEPAEDPHWMYATRDQKAAYMRAIRVLILAEWDKQMAAGLGTNGRKLAPLKMGTRMRRHSEMGPADKNAPPLIPAHSLSRTRSLVEAKVIGLTVRVYWKFDPITGKRWGTILGYHRDGKGNLPKRNVMGLSKKGYGAVKKAAHLWWKGYVAGLPTSMPTRPRPGRAARKPMAVLPREPTANHPNPTGASPNLAVGGDIYTVTRGGAAALLGAIKAGTFTGGRSYAGAQ